MAARAQGNGTSSLSSGSNGAASPGRVDAAGAIFIGLVIVYRWWEVGDEQVEKIVGKSAPKEFIDQVNAIATDEDPRVAVDVTRVYYCGARFLPRLFSVLLIYFGTTGTMWRWRLCCQRRWCWLRPTTWRW